MKACFFDIDGTLYSHRTNCVPESAVTALRRLREKGILDHCDVTSWHEHGIDIVAKGSGKDVGIARYIEQNGIKREETMAFGDGENDIRMLRFAGTGVAMGNASEAAKAAADYVTSDIDDDGIARALQHFGLI